MLTDFHLHTLVSDGTLEPIALLRAAAARSIGRLSITDHDALGAYAWREGAVFAEARRLGLELIVGLEMDVDLDGFEVHLLGYGVSLEHAGLRSHLDRVRERRFERARREIGIVNGLLGAGTISDGEIFAPGRETLMKPHFIHPILDKGLFATYEEANAWFRDNVKSGVAVPKPSFPDAIALIRAAGGWSCLAHPGYYQKAGVDIVARLPALSALGLGGLELDYPYHACSPHLFDRDAERAFVAEIGAVAGSLGLRTTRGSDCHTPADFEQVYGPPS